MGKHTPVCTPCYKDACSWLKGFYYTWEIWCLCRMYPPPEGSFPYLHEISVWGRSSPSQFHTETAGGLLQQRPHRKSLFFLLFGVPRSRAGPARCCWELLLLGPCTPGLSGCSITPSSMFCSVLSSSSSSSWSSPRGRENRTALTRCTSTKGRSN